MSAFDWKDFLDTADHIFTNKSLLYFFYQQKQESVLRTIISRAYYAIFKQIEDHLISKQISYKLPNKGSHDSVIIYLQRFDARFSRKLARLKGLRIVSDYKQKQRVVDRDAETAIQLAKFLNSSWSDLKSLI